MKTWAYYVTFESDTQPCESVRGTVQAGALPTAATRAMKAAKKQKPSKNRARSVVLLLQPAAEARAAVGGA